MSGSVNPYAPPPIVAEQVNVLGLGGQDGGVWRSGKLLVMHKSARLPARCIKSNEPSERSLKRNLVWYPQWIILTILIAWPIFLVLALILQKKATIEIGLTEAWVRRRRQRIAITWGVALLGVALFAIAIALLDATDGGSSILMLAALAALIGALIYGTTAARLVSPTKIDDRFVYLKGACAEYLAQFPEWPGTR